jgi:hypothetical protein
MRIFPYYPSYLLNKTGGKSILYKKIDFLALVVIQSDQI